VRRSVGWSVPASGTQIEPEQTCAADRHPSGREAQINFWGPVPPAEEKQAARVLDRCGPVISRSGPGVIFPRANASGADRARVMARRREMLFLDEPCAGLDPVAREDFLNFLSVLSKNTSCAHARLVRNHCGEIVPLFTTSCSCAAERRSPAGAREEVLTSAHLPPLRRARCGFAAHRAPAIAWRWAVTRDVSKVLRVTLDRSVSLLPSAILPVRSTAGLRIAIVQLSDNIARLDMRA